MVLNLYPRILIVKKKKVLFVDSFEKLTFISGDEFVKKQGENGSGGNDVSNCRNKDGLSWLFLNH